MSAWPRLAVSYHLAPSPNGQGPTWLFAMTRARKLHLRPRTTGNARSERQPVRTRGQTLRRRRKPRLKQPALCLT